METCTSGPTFSRRFLLFTRTAQVNMKRILFITLLVFLSACIPTVTPTLTPTVTVTPGSTPTPSSTFTATMTVTHIPSSTSTPSSTVTPTRTSTPTITTTPTVTRTFTPTTTATNTRQPSATPPPGVEFTFASMGDGQGLSSYFSKTTNQIASLHPNIVLFNGDLENDGVTTTAMNTMVGVLKTSGIFNQTFLVRGNHDDHVSGSAALWNTYFSTPPNVRINPDGLANYVYMAPGSTYLTYSFDYGNSRFIALDVPGGASLITSAQYTFIDQRLTNAEELGYVHAFIFFHGGEYCIESTHCSCTAKSDASCTQTAFINLVNKHPIVSATFHGHEHILGWVHMDNTRLSSLTHAYEQFFTSPAGGGSYNSYIYPTRVDYYYRPMASSAETDFATVTVHGTTFTVNLYKVGITAPVWTKTFTK